MKRRNVIAGIGSLAAAGAAGMGTSAFTSATAARSTAVTVADDSEAYLALRSTSEYAVETGANTLKLNFDEGVDGGGSHVGKSSGYSFGSGDPEQNVFKVVNQGTQPVELTPQWEEYAYDSDGDLLARKNSVDDSTNVIGNLPSDAELFIGIYNKYFKGPATLSPGDEFGYFATVATGDTPPSSVSTRFEISADAV